VIGVKRRKKRIEILKGRKPIAIGKFYWREEWWRRAALGGKRNALIKVGVSARGRRAGLKWGSGGEGGGEVSGLSQKRRTCTPVEFKGASGRKAEKKLIGGKKNYWYSSTARGGKGIASATLGPLKHNEEGERHHVSKKKPLEEARFS